MTKKIYMQPSVRTLHFAHRTILASSVTVDTSQSGSGQRSLKKGSGIWNNDEDESQQPKSGIWQ